MSTNSRYACSTEPRQPTNLRKFCRDLHTQFAPRLKNQRVRFDCDVAEDLSFDLPQSFLRRLLYAWIDDALSEMPDGGELDITVVRAHAALEIEVADSRTTESAESNRSPGRPHSASGDGRISVHPSQALRLDMAMCPQGGVARTVIIPSEFSMNHGVRFTPRRKVA